MMFDLFSYLLVLNRKYHSNNHFQQGITSIVPYWSVKVVSSSKVTIML